MPKSNKKDRKENQALLKALGVKMRYEYPPEYHKTECSICLKKIKKGEQLTLQCGHVYHGKCLFNWALKNTKDGQCDTSDTTTNYSQARSNIRRDVWVLRSLHTDDGAL